MIRFILFVLLLLLLFRSLHFLAKEIFARKKPSNSESDPEELIQDPCCQVYIPAGSAVKKRITGRDYYFCSEACARKFLAERKTQNPDRQGLKA